MPGSQGGSTDGIAERGCIVSAPRTRNEDTEYYAEGGTFDHEAEPEYEPDVSDIEFDISEDTEEKYEWAS